MSAEKRLFNRKNELAAAKAVVKDAEAEVKRLLAEIAALTKDKD